LTTTIFLAGATGVIGLRAARLLYQAGYAVYGTTRSASKSDVLRDAGAIPIVVDVFDREALIAAMMSIRPSIVMHQLTDLSRLLDPAFELETITANARMRSVGTNNLIAGALASGAERVIAQSIAWGYAARPEPHAEADPLDIHAAGVRAISVGGVVALENQVTNSPPLEGAVLRFGRLYGPGTGVDRPQSHPTVHADAAAHASLLAIERARSGIFNIADDNTVVSTEKARSVLGWTPSFRMQP
jgi:nucleoside-diphosphate-sugar epimerase